MLRGSDYAISETGDSWLMLGDCLDRMSEIPDNSVDLVLTDPPYGTTACKWDSVIPLAAMWAQLNRIAKKEAAVVLFGSEPFSSALRMSNISNYKYDWIWIKSKGVGFLNAKRQPLRKSENVSVFYRAQCAYNPQGLIVSNKTNKCIVKNMKTFRTTNQGHTQSVTYRNYPNNLQSFKNDKGLHPTQKPVALMEYLIKTYTSEGDTVLDFTMGSGTTGVAANNLKRQFIGIERDTKFFDIAIGRINDST